MTRTGTNHFTSFDSAVRYFNGQDRSLTRAQCKQWVEEKLRGKEIVIGPPGCDPGAQRLSIDPVEGRYFIVDFED